MYPDALWHAPPFSAKFSVVLGPPPGSNEHTHKASPTGAIPLTTQRGLWGPNSILPWEPIALVGFPQAAL